MAGDLVSDEKSSVPTAVANFDEVPPYESLAVAVVHAQNRRFPGRWKIWHVRIYTDPTVKLLSILQEITRFAEAPRSTSYRKVPRVFFFQHVPIVHTILHTVL